MNLVELFIRFIVVCFFVFVAVTVTVELFCNPWRSTLRRLPASQPEQTPQPAPKMEGRAKDDAARAERELEAREKDREAPWREWAERRGNW